MFIRLAHFVTVRRRWVLAGSVVVLLGLLVLAGGTFSVLKAGGFDDPASGSSKAQTLLDDNFGGAANLLLLVTPGTGTELTDPTTIATVDRVTGVLRQDRNVDSVTSWWSSHSDSLRAADGRSAVIAVHVTGDESAAAGSARRIIEHTTTRSGPVTVRAGGQLGVGNDVTNQVAKDLAIAESIAVPITLVLLLIAFGSAVAAVLPLAVGLMAIAGAFGVLDVLGHLTDVSTYSINLTTAMGLGLAIDYSLLIVNRFREELAIGDTIEAALRRTLRTAGRTVLFSSATVAVALGAMLVFPLYFLRSFAYAGIGVVLIAMLASLITLPALLAVLGPRVNAGRVRRRTELRPASAESRFWRRIAGLVMRRPVVTGLPVVAVLLVLGSPFLHINFATPDDRVLPGSLQSRQVGNILRADYPENTAAAIYPVLKGNPSQAEVGRYAAELSALAGARSVTAGAGVFVHGSPAASTADPQLTRSGVQYLIVNGPSDANSAASQQLVKEVRAVPPPAGSTAYVGGAPAALVDSKHGIAAGLPWAVGWIAISTFVLLFLFTGSVLLPIKALVLNVLSLSAVFGAMVWIFQYGHLSGLLGFTPGPINTSMPVLLFCIAFGLSMDYECILLSRIVEEHRRGAGTVLSVARGVDRTAGLFTWSALILAVVMAALATSGLVFLKAVGVGLALAALLDATVVRGLLVPAVMRLAGRANWWAPAWLRGGR